MNYQKQNSKIIDAFLKDNGIRDVFDLGYFFHLYCDNKIEQYDLKDINQYDALIFDMQKVSPHSNLFKTETQDERESLALKNIQALDKEPMPLYIPDPLKKESYEKILHKVILDFLERYKKMLTMR